MSDARTQARTAPGFQDVFAADLLARQRMIDTITAVYRRYGFAPLETPAIEYLDALGKYLPESDEPQGGVFAFKDDDEQWISLRYDLTAPLSRVVAQHSQELPSPYRRYQVGPVFRREKPGPGRFRQFYQCDFDTVGSASPAADAEVCGVLATAFEALGLAGNFEIRINDRKLLNGVLETVGLDADNPRRGTVLRAMDKLDRLGPEGVRQLLGKGRRDPTGDFTKGAELSAEHIDAVMGFCSPGPAGESRAETLARLAPLIEKSSAGAEGLAEMRQIDSLLSAMGFDSTVVRFDPTVVRGLAYYTGPVFEAVLTFEITDDDGNRRSFGSVAGGGRYDDLVQRFTGNVVPATGASIGVDRLLAALKAKGQGDTRTLIGPVVVTVMDQPRLVDYQKMVFELRSAGIDAELYLGSGGFRAQMKYADKRLAPVVIIAGENEFSSGMVSIKDMRKGAELAKSVQDREAWRKGQPAQQNVAKDQLVATVKAILES